MSHSPTEKNKGESTAPPAHQKNDPAAKPQVDPPVTTDPVDESSDESFPASDPPSWTDTSATKDSPQ